MNNAGDSLDARLEVISGISNEQWLSNLSDRKRKELSFHDRDRDRDKIQTLDTDTYEKFYGNKKYYGATGDSRSYVDQWIATNAKGKVFLDYACGNGARAIFAAKAGARMVIGLDISSVSVENARRDAEAAGVSANCRFIQADAENTLLPADSIDTILCSGMLHHLDLSFALPELRRILAPGGRILAVEALDYNPAIKMYRYMTPAMRTDWEKAHILSLKDLTFASRFFDVRSVNYWHITSILSPHLPFLAKTFQTLDRLLTKVPLVKLMAWMFTFEMVKTTTEKALELPAAPKAPSLPH